MKVTMSLSLRVLSVFITVSFLSTIGASQVKIHEKIEIAPKIKISEQVNSSSTTNTTIPLLFKAPFYSPEILTTRPCHITASGSINYQWAGDGHSYAVLWIEGENFIDYDLCLIWETSITATPVSFDVGNCYWADVKIYHGGGWGIGSLSGEVSGNQAIFEWTEATGTVATATVIATPLPEYELSNCVMTANPTYLDANDDRSHEANIRAALYNGSGNPFEICGWYWCWFPSSMTFNIENPLNGMTLRGQQHDGTYVEGTSIEVSLGSAASNVFFVWDGGDIPNEIDTVSIRAEAYGVSAVQKIQLKKIVPHHFAVTPDVDIIYAGESVNVRAIAKDINDEEVALDGGKSVTFSDYSGKGSFIVGSDTIPNQATVSYDMAKSGSIKYYSKLDPSNLVDQYIMLWVALTEHPERNGYGYLEVITSCPVVHISRREVSPGDTAVVSIMARIKDGTELPYPPEQSFVIWMNTDEQYGRLRCISTGDEGSYVYGQQPFEFIAADNIDVDSTVVEIEASISTGGGGGGGAASIIDIGTKDTLRMPAGLMMKMLASKSEIGITGSTPVTAKERIRIHSFEKLRKRLNTIRAKAKNKSQFDKIIAKMEARLAGTNEVTKNTIITPKSLAKTGQIAMSVEEGEYCELPIADVTIKKKCPNIKFDINGNPVEYPGIMDITDTRVKFNISDQPAENPAGCSDANSNQVGATGPSKITHGVGGGTYSIGKGGSGSWYLDKLEITIPWGICTEKIKNLFGENVILVDETHNYPTNVTDAKAMIKDFRMFQVNGVVGKFTDIKYFPLVDTREHEKSHINLDYKPIMSVVYCQAFLDIYYSPLPPSHWCTQDEKNMDEWLNEFLPNNKKDIDSKFEWAAAEIESELNSLSKEEKEQYEAGYKAIQVLIAKIKKDFNIN